MTDDIKVIPMETQKQIGLGRQQKRQKERDEHKQKEQMAAYFNAYPKRSELLLLKQRVDQISGAALQMNDLQDVLSDILIKKNIVTEEEIRTGFTILIEKRKKIEQVVKEPDWLKKFELCTELELDPIFLIEHIKEHPMEVPPDVLETLKTKYTF